MRLKAFLPVLLLGLSFLFMLPMPAGATTPANQATVYQTGSNQCVLGGAGTCALTLPVTYGDLLVVTYTGDSSAGGSFTFADSFASPYITVSTGASSHTAFISYAQAPASGSDTFTVGYTAVSTLSIQVMVVRGLFTGYIVTTGTGTGSSGALSTSSTSYSGFTWFCAASLLAAGGSAGTLTAGADFTLIQDPAGGGYGAEYSTTVTSPTTFPATSGTYGSWYDAGACFARNVIHPSDIQINQWPNSANYFYVNEYKDSYAQVGFPSAQPTVISPVTVPQLDPTLTGSNLISLYLGGTSYFDTLIPSTNNTFYVPYPNTASEYLFNVQDLSGTFGANSKIYLKLGSLTMASGYLDASNGFTAWLPAGSYSVSLTDPQGTSTYATIVNLQASSSISSIAIQILSSSYSNVCGTSCVINKGASISSGAISIGFSDSSTSTTSINDSVYHRWLNGTVTRFYTKLSSGTWGSFTDSISCATDACNSSIISQFYVKMIYSDAYGSNQVLTFAIGGGSLGSSIPFANLGNLGGWITQFGNSVTPYDFVSLLIVLMTAGSFGAYASKFGAVVLSIEVVALEAMGWLVGMSFAMGTLLVVVAVIGYIGFLEALH